MFHSKKVCGCMSCVCWCEKRRWVGVNYGVCQNSVTQSGSECVCDLVHMLVNPLRTESCAVCGMGLCVVYVCCVCVENDNTS